MRRCRPSDACGAHDSPKLRVDDRRVISGIVHVLPLDRRPDQLLSDTASINEQIKNVIDRHTEPWGTQVTAVESKDIVLPDNMQRAMAKEAEAERERRAKIVAAEGEYQAAVKLGQAADTITQHPVALQLRTLQTMAEISVEKKSTIIFPAQFMTTVQEAFARLSREPVSK